MKYDTATGPGRRALARRLRARPDDVLALVEQAGLAPYTVLSDKDVAEILRATEVIPSTNPSWARAVDHARRVALRRCRQHVSTVREARRTAFGSGAAKFPRDLEAALAWLRSLQNPSDGAEEATSATHQIIDWLHEDWRGHSSLPEPLNRIRETAEWLALTASVSRREALLYILTDDVDPEPPVRVTIRARYGSPNQILITASDFVPARVVGDAFSEARRKATGRGRGRPGRRRDAKNLAKPLSDLMISDVAEYDEINALSSVVNDGPLWKLMAPGMDDPPNRSSSTTTRMAIIDGESRVIPDSLECEWDFEPFSNPAPRPSRRPANRSHVV